MSDPSHVVLRRQFFLELDYSVIHESPKTKISIIVVTFFARLSVTVDDLDCAGGTLPFFYCSCQLKHY